MKLVKKYKYLSIEQTSPQGTPLAYEIKIKMQLETPKDSKPTGPGVTEG